MKLISYGILNGNRAASSYMLVGRSLNVVAENLRVHPLSAMNSLMFGEML